MYFVTFESDKYSKFDANGVPTHDKNGVKLTVEITNGLNKKMKSLQKKFDRLSKK